MLKHIFFAAPHRLMFAGGAMQLLLSMIFWGLVLVLRYGGGEPLALAWPEVWLHGGLMVFGIFSWFIFGFLMTALPKWMQVEAMSEAQFQPPFGFLAMGWMLFYLGLKWPSLAVPGLVLVLAGWLWGAVALGQVVLGSGVDRRHGYAVVTALFLGAFGLLAYCLALANVDADWFRIAIETGLWLFLAPVFFTVFHRMLPFFSASVIKDYRPYAPMGVLAAMLGAFALHGLLAMGGFAPWGWLPDSLAAVLAWHMSSRWGLRASLSNPMLAVLHLAGLWLGAAMSLYCLQGLLAVLGVAWGGLMPLHALGLGFFTSAMIGMGTRVTRGHSGLVISEDTLVWPLFWLFQGVVLLRLLGEFVGAVGLAHPYVIGAALWVLVFGVWAWHYVPHFFKPRQDGLPG